MDISGTECARARESVSADLDRELQELDLRRLQAHLRVCADCSAWAEHVKAATVQLREAPFEAPPAAVVELPRRGRTWRVGAAVAVASAAALVASVVSLGGAQQGRPTTSTPLSPTDSHFVRNVPLVGMYGLPALHRVFQPV
jgi:predicted anti-sigma-YlaC factor YlaD